MKTAEWKRVAAPIDQLLPDYRPMNFGFVRLTNWIAMGFYADSSAFEASAFYVEAFMIPRFVPAESIYFDYGFRVSGRWEAGSPELASTISAARPRLEQTATLDGLIDAADQPDSNLYHAELHLCVAVIEEDETGTRDASDRINRWKPSLPWESDVLARTADLARRVAEKGFPAGIAELKRRREDVDRLFK